MSIKSLELYGFKSFAERNRLEIPAGVTIIAGPNGSGKSNVVDAIKWVLGEQSLKSLRGKESTDVIFNGASGRKALNLAEVTLTFDNTDRRLACEEDQVSITRRIYRGGEAEYLINRQVRRLKDIRDLLMGTGLGAYSIIEQGRVDALLQSSPQERRVLFEEAAGISRFKKNKQEALRRLENCEQKLLRLSDIVSEVQKNLTRVKSQAERAARYREYTTRLQELRFQSAAIDYTTQAEKLEQCGSQIQSLSDEYDTWQGQIDGADAQIQQCESRFSECQQRLSELATKIASNLHAIGAAESVIELQSTRSRELEQTVRDIRDRWSDMRAKMSHFLTFHQKMQNDLRQAQTRHVQVVADLEAAKKMFEAADAAMAEARAEKEKCRDESVAWAREVTAAENALAAVVRQEGDVERQFSQNESRIAAVSQELESLRQSYADLESEQAELEAWKRRCEEDRAAAVRELEVCRRMETEANANLAALHQRHSSMGGRISTLQELQEKFEGLSPGVRYLLTEAKRQADGPFHDICGLVVDLIQVQSEASALVEVALGERAQYLVVAPGSTLLDSLRQNSGGFPGRVGFLWMDDFQETAECVARHAGVLLTNGLANVPGVVGRADQFVACEAPYLSVVKFLLGETWIVENLDTAVRLRREVLEGKHPLPLFPAVDLPGSRKQIKSAYALPPRIHFVTLSGERLDADGVLCVGRQHESAGLISRRSELRTLSAQMTLLLDEIHRADEEVAKTAEKARKGQETTDNFEKESRDADRKLRELDKRVMAVRERIDLIQSRVTEMREQNAELEKKRVVLREKRAATQAKKAEVDAQDAEIAGRLRDLEVRVRGCEEERRKRNEAFTSRQVDLAKSEERLEGLKSGLIQNEDSARERSRSMEEQREQLRKALSLMDESSRRILDSESKLSELYSRKEAWMAEQGKVKRESDGVRKERSDLNATANRWRKKLRLLEEKMGTLQVEMGKTEQERETLLERIAEDFDMTPEAFLERLENETPEEKEKYGEVQKEINELRTLIQGLGNINSEALAEMDHLETRYTQLSADYNDLREAKEKLLKLIERINVVSRKLFLKTFENVGGYFYELFRDLFGGGHAELQLDEGVDVLDSGIEIIAQPPGKELRSLSLMSGGEKTMTCVALLFALFKNKPSQFCILDEVDAALDEANIARLTGILGQFSDQTQFLVVTHNRKTMLVGNVRYGVTMQDSGVSKLLSQKDEEVSDNGEIETLGIRLFPDDGRAVG
ncbi:MAG: AAA family ATPase [Planctomycetia bacterium]|nr:AAA family ATPase [Planctomycetia bacterium]